MRMKDKISFYSLINLRIMKKTFVVISIKKQQCFQRDFNQSYNHITYQLAPWENSHDAYVNILTKTW